MSSNLSKYIGCASIVPRGGLRGLRPNTVTHVVNNNVYVIMRRQALALLTPEDWIEVVW